MALASRRWVLAVVAAAGAAFACNAIVGVEDVKLKGTGGTRLTNDSGNPIPGDDDDDDDTPRDSGPIEEDNPHPQLALGFSHVCARMLNSTVRCWGSNGDGQLGDGADLDASRPPDTLRPKDVPGVSDALMVATGSFHTCILRKSGKVSCWGYNANGQLGNGGIVDSSKPIDVLDIDDAIAVAAGGNTTCAIKANKKLLCWGQNLRGGLGDGTTSTANKPVAVQDIDDVAQVAPGGNHTCAVRTNGEVWCWGGGAEGQLGNGFTTDTLKPTGKVPSLSDVVQVVAANSYSCARTRAGRIHCWGNNDDGQLGAGAASTDPSPSPISVALEDVVSLSAGTSHTCAVQKGGATLCWGYGASGQLGIGPIDSATLANTRIPSPTAVVGLTTAFRVWTGSSRSCAVTTDNKALCWGSNTAGALGNGSTDRTPIPVPVSDF